MQKQKQLQRKQEIKGMSCNYSMIKSMQNENPSNTQSYLRKQVQRLSICNEQLKQKLQKYKLYVYKEEKQKEDDLLKIKKELMDTFPQCHKQIYYILQEKMMKWFDQSKIDMSCRSSNLLNSSNLSQTNIEKTMAQVMNQFDQIQNKNSKPFLEGQDEKQKNDSIYFFKRENSTNYSKQSQISQLQRNFEGISKIEGSNQSKSFQRQSWWRQILQNQMQKIKAQYEKKLQQKDRKIKELTLQKLQIVKRKKEDLKNLLQQSKLIKEGILIINPYKQKQIPNILKYFQQIKDLTYLNIKKITLDGCHINSDNIQSLAKSDFPKLEFISIMNAGLEKLQHFQKFKHLKNLQLGNNLQLSKNNSKNNSFDYDQILKFFSHQYKNLTTLSLSVTPQIIQLQIIRLKNLYQKLLKDQMQKKVPMLNKLVFTYIQVKGNSKFKDQPVDINNVIVKWQQSMKKSILSSVFGGLS